MNAVIKAGGKQYYVTEGCEIFVEKLNANSGDVVTFDQVLMLDSKVGNPYLNGVTVTGEEFPIKPDDKTFITIRNVPYTELNVLNVSSEARQTAVASSKAKDAYVLVKDPAQPAIFDAVVTITDTAKITKDGAVVGGNKIKMGLPVTLEGNNYKFNGTISDVRVTTKTDVEDDGSNNQVG